MLREILLLTDSRSVGGETLVWLAIVVGLIVLNNAILKAFYPANRYSHAVTPANPARASGQLHLIASSEPKIPTKAA